MSTWGKRQLIQMFYSSLGAYLVVLLAGKWTFSTVHLVPDVDRLVWVAYMFGALFWMSFAMLASTYPIKIKRIWWPLIGISAPISLLWVIWRYKKEGNPGYDEIE